METSRWMKVYVRVQVEFMPEGRMLPRIIEWEDGRKYEIDRVKDMRPAHAEKAGGQGDRYTIIVGRKERYLFFEHSAEFADPFVGKWFVERRAE